MEEEFKFDVGQTVYYDSIINKHLGEIISRKKKYFGLFKPKLKTLYLVKDEETGMIFEFCEESLWSLHNERC